MPVYIVAGLAGSDTFPYAGGSCDIVAAENGLGGLNEADKRMRNEARDFLRQQDQGATCRIDNVIQREVSRERLLELAEQARTRADIIAERVAISNL